VQGAGSGGGNVPVATGSQVGVAPGGSEGAYAMSYLTAVQLSQIITVGLAGAAGGGTGGTSSFGALVSAVGALGAAGNSSVPPIIQNSGIGGTTPTSGNLINSRGRQGGPGIAQGISNFISGAGAPSRFGQGGISQSSASAPGDAAPASSYGAGGGGALTGGAAETGGAAANGCVVVWEYA